MKIILLLLLSLNCFSQEVIEKHYYIGENNIATGWQGPWPSDQLKSINAICEVIFEGESSIPVKISHLKLNTDGTLKCPVEIDTSKKSQAILDDEDQALFNQELKFSDCKVELAKRKSEINKIAGLHDKAKLLAKQKDCVK